MKIRGDFFTNIDQSKHLLDLGLNPETADMCWGIDDDTMKYNNNPYPLPWKDYTVKEFYLPCWSLGALMDVMPSGCNLSTPKAMNASPYCCWNQDMEFYGTTSISAAIAMINWLVENNKMCEEAVESEDEKLREQVVYAINQLHVCECTKNKLIAWVKKQGEEEQLYIRFGEIPTDEKSKIYQGEIEVGTENGVSVYPAFRTDEGNIVLGLSLPITKSTLYTQQHLLEYDDRPCYLVKGDYVGKDSDGQPLINNVSIIKKIDGYRVKSL